MIRQPSRPGFLKLPGPRPSLWDSTRSTFLQTAESPASAGLSHKLRLTSPLKAFRRSHTQNRRYRSLPVRRARDPSLVSQCASVCCTSGSRWTSSYPLLSCGHQFWQSWPFLDVSPSKIVSARTRRPLHAASTTRSFTSAQNCGGRRLDSLPFSLHHTRF